MIAGEQLDLLLTVRSPIDGHNLPTGSTFIRQMWLEVIVRDAADAAIYETGTLDANGDLRNFWSEIDPHGDGDLVAFHSSLVGEDGRPVLFPWIAVEHRTLSLPPRFARTFTLFVATAVDTRGPLAVSARLRFRTHAAYLLRAVGLPELVDRIEIHDLASASTVVEVTVP